MTTKKQEMADEALTEYLMPTRLTRHSVFSGICIEGKALQRAWGKGDLVAVKEAMRRVRFMCDEAERIAKNDLWNNIRS